MTRLTFDAIMTSSEMSMAPWPVKMQLYPMKTAWPMVMFSP